MDNLGSHMAITRQVKLRYLWFTPIIKLDNFIWQLSASNSKEKNSTFYYISVDKIVPLKKYNFRFLKMHEILQSNKRCYTQVWIRLNFQWKHFISWKAEFIFNYSFLSYFYNFFCHSWYHCLFVIFCFPFFQVELLRKLK